MSFNYTSVREFESKACPGVTVVLKKQTHQRYTEYKRSVAKPLQQIMQLEMERYRIGEEYREAEKAAVLTPCTCEHEHDPDSKRCTLPECSCSKGKPEWPAEKDARFNAITAELRDLNEDELQPPLLKWGVKKFRGLVIDGNADPSPELLLSDGPPELVEEIAGELVSQLLLTPAETKNSGSPTTSGEQVDGATKITTVPDAASETPLKRETAMADFFQPT